MSALPQRVSLWERWSSVVVSALIGSAVTGYVVGFVAWVIACISARDLIAPPNWWYYIVGTACVMTAVFFGMMGWTDPPWGGRTFDAREKGY